MRGLSFRRRKRKIHLSAVQGVAFWIGEVILAFVIGCMLVWFFGYPLSNVGQSMEPAVYSGEKVLVNRLVYELKAPDYGDLIVFKPNGNVNAHYYIKRVVGVPGDSVTIAGLAEEGVTLGEDEFFVLGDNRNNSEDSRSADVGNVKRQDILGKAWFVVTPGERFGWLH